jgi:flagellar FliL protein
MFKFFKKKAPAAEGQDGDANLPAVTDGADATDGEAPQKKKLPLLFIIGPIAAVLIAGGGAGAFILFKPKSEAHAADTGGHAAPKSDKKGGHGAASGAPADPALGRIAPGPDGVTFYTLPEMIVNIQSNDGRATFLKLTLTLEMRDAHLADTLMAESPRMQDMFQGFLRELRPEDLAGSAGSHQLRAEILRRVNLIAAPGTVDAVLIEEMLVQ